MESKDSDFFVTGFVILVALVLILFGAIVTVFSTSWINMIIDNVSYFIAPAHSSKTD
jgi:uncharacterized membrane protein